LNSMILVHKGLFNRLPEARTRRVFEIPRHISA